MAPFASLHIFGFLYSRSALSLLPALRYSAEVKHLQRQNAEKVAENVHYIQRQNVEKVAENVIFFFKLPFAGFRG
jgi:hypothetical protein